MLWAIQPFDISHLVFKKAGGPPLPSNINIPTLRFSSNDHKGEARWVAGNPPAKLTERDIEILVRDSSSIPAYAYALSNPKPEDKLPIFVFFHSGGFRMGTRHDDTGSNRITTLEAGIILVSLDYRLVPRYPFPHAIHDGVDGSHWIAQYPTQVHPSASLAARFIIGGIPAEAYIANGVVYLNCDLGSPVNITGLFLNAGPLFPSPFVPEKYNDYISHEQNRNVTFPPEDTAQILIAAWMPDPNSPIIAPAAHLSGNSGIPLTYFQVFAFNALRDESIIYMRILEAEDILMRLYLNPDLPHTFGKLLPQLTKEVDKRTNIIMGGIWRLIKDSKQGV